MTSITPWSDLFRRKEGVGLSPELTRILNLPRRDWRDHGVESARLLTEVLKTPQGTQALRPIQGATLREILEVQGAFAPIRVGGGKTLISLLAFVMLDAQRPLLLLPAALVKKTEREQEELRKHWQIPAFVRIVSYELLSRKDGQYILENYRPDAIVADEGHKLRNGSAAVTKKVKRYIRAYPNTKMVILSGTITKRSIRDYSHLADWTLRSGSPVPRDWNTAMEWAGAIDEKRDEETYIPPGALVGLLNHSEELRQEYLKGDPLRAVRQGYRDRLVHTPGVVSSFDDVIGTSLNIRGVDLKLPAEVEDAYRMMRNKNETPDGHPIATPVELWRHCRELSCGFYYRWSPRPPSDWLMARQAWCAFVRETLKHSRTLDSELQVAMAVRRGQINDFNEVYTEWKGIRDTFTPNVEAVWMHEAAIDLALAWAQKPGLIWVDFKAFGLKLQERGLRYFAARGEDSSGRPVESADPNGPAIVLSVQSNSQGRNLQAWSRNLIVSAPPTGALWEQMLGRTHRDGQVADEVDVEVVLGCKEQVQGFHRAVRDARFIEATTGQPQKLTQATIEVRDE